MDIRQCERCDRLYEYYGRPLCMDCVRKLDEIFVNVRNYIYENAQATIEEILDHTNADEKDIIGWLREGRLIMSADSPALLHCDCCGASIREGRFCERCSDELQKELKSGMRDAPQKDRPPAIRPEGGDSKGMHGRFR